MKQDAQLCYTTVSIKETELKYSSLFWRNSSHACPTLNHYRNSKTKTKTKALNATGEGSPPSHDLLASKWWVALSGEGVTLLQ